MEVCKRTWRRALPLAALLFVTTGVARPARTQGGFFYAEEERSGRIYVFSQAKEYEAWKKSGELGRAITRPGAGPDGETMVFDNEDAINLYNFKHDRPGEVIVEKEESKPVQKMSWKDGKTTFETDAMAIQLSNRVQIRYSVEDPDSSDAKGSFRIRRAKTKFEGWFFRRNLTAELQMNWADTTNSLEDAQLNYDFLSDKRIMIKAGQFKVPFGRQELTSSGSQQFVDRSIVSAEFEKGRDIGVQLWGNPMAGKLDWRVGLFNGAGRNKTANDNRKYQYNGRLTYQPWGDVKYSESDFESKDHPLLAVAVDFESNDLRDVDPMVNELKRTVLGVDGAFKYKGFSAMTEYFHKRNKPEEGSKFDTDGWHVQVGYFVTPQRLEIAGRYASFDPTDLKGGNDRSEKGVAVNYFFNKHALKLQGDYRRVEDQAKAAAGRKTDEVRVQTQFIF